MYKPELKFFIVNANHHMSFQWVVITDHHNRYKNNEKVWNVPRVTKMTQIKASKCCWKNGINWCSTQAATNHQFVKISVSGKHKKPKYLSASTSIVLHSNWLSQHIKSLSSLQMEKYVMRSCNIEKSQAHCSSTLS